MKELMLAFRIANSSSLQRSLMGVFIDLLLMMRASCALHLA